MGGNIDPVPKDVVAVDDDIADIDADAEDDALVLGHARIAADHAALDYHRAPDRIDDTGKFDQRAVARGLDDTATMTGNRPVDQRPAMGFQRLQSADLIGLHKPAVRPVMWPLMRGFRYGVLDVSGRNARLRFP